MLRLLALLAALAPAALAQPDTLDVDVLGAMRLALDGSPEVEIERAGRDFAAARARQARAARFLTEFSLTTGHAVAPGLDRNGSTLPADQLYLDPGVRNDWDDARPYNEFTAEAIQPLWTWGELSGQIRAADAAVTLEEAQAAAKASEVALRTGELYYGLLLAETLSAIAVETGEALGTARGELQGLLDEGDASVSDADLFQLRLFEQEYLRQRAEVGEQRALAASALGRQVLRPGAAVRTRPLEPIAFERDSLGVYQRLGLAHRAELRQAEAGLRARDALVRVAKSDYYPKLFIGGRASGRYAEGRTQQGNPFISDSFLGAGLRFGVGVRQNLTFFQTRAKVQQAEAERAEVRFQQTAAEQLVLFEVEEAYRRLVIAEAALRARREAVRIAGEWLRTEQINFDLALGDVDDLIAAVRADLESRAARLEAVQTYNVAVLRLLHATGTLAERAERGTGFGPSSGG
ncbi:MAG: TolC family protein [Bacteroidota bacterium]